MNRYERLTGEGRVLIENWPPYFMGGEVPELRVGNPDACVGVITLWTPVDLIWPKLDRNKIAVIGQLKTPGAGIDGIIRTCAANRAIRYLVVCGREMKEGVGGEALMNLIENGADERGKIIGGPAGAKISDTIPIKEIDKFRENITLIDLRGIVDPAKIQEIISGFSYKDPQGEAVLLPLPEVGREKFPRKVGAELVITPTIAEAYVQILEKILRFGPSAMTNYGQEAEDVLNIITITDKEVEDKTSWQILPFTKSQVEDYIQKNFLTKELPRGEWYTYGERIFAFGPQKINQFEVIVGKLLKDKNDRGAIAVLYDPDKDNRALRNPCLYAFQASIEQDKLFLTGVFRSNDMANAWSWNAFGLRRIQELIFERVKTEYPDLTMSSLITVSTRAHIYQSAREVAEYLVKKHKEKVREGWDPKGNFLLKIEKGEIVARLVPPDGSGKILQEFRGKSAHEVSQLIARTDAISQISHALEIGIHLGWAEMALKKGWAFIQEERWLDNLT